MKKFMCAELIMNLEDTRSLGDILASWHSCTTPGHTAHSLLWGSVRWHRWDNVVPASDFACASPPYFLCDWGSSWNIKLSPELSQHSQWHLEVENASQIFMRYVSIFQITLFPWRLTWNFLTAFLTNFFLFIHGDVSVIKFYEQYSKWGRKINFRRQQTKEEEPCGEIWKRRLGLMCPFLAQEMP